jgi:hypothetical protein
MWVGAHFRDEYCFNRLVINNRPQSTHNRVTAVEEVDRVIIWLHKSNVGIGQPDRISRHQSRHRSGG